MKTERQYKRIPVTKKGERWLQTGHPWIYESDISFNPSGEDGKDVIPNGAVVDAVSESGKYLGSGFYSRFSKIRIRLISRNANDTFDAAFWQRRIKYAVDYRMTVMGDDTDALRVIFGEADGFPGLTVDKFHDLLSVQILSVGIENLKDLIIPSIVNDLRARGFEINGVYERNDQQIRQLEGLPVFKGWYEGEGIKAPSSPVTKIVENGIIYDVDVENGQKTGFFLDQKYNRLAVSKIAKGKRVLDCFTHTGSFALNAAKGGAEHVTAVDISKTAIDMAQKNAQQNGLSGKMDFLTKDIFELLPELIEKGGKNYDFIILDPPAFTKSRDTAGNARRGYKEINYRAMKLLPRGGYLATASCSHFMPHEEFEKMLVSASRDAGVSLKQIEMRQQAPDHPIMWNVPETDYLKFYIFQVI